VRGGGKLIYDDDQEVIMKQLLVRIFTLAGVALLAAPAVGTAEVRRVELDIAGYLCGA
jgi:hypothetical protein